MFSKLVDIIRQWQDAPDPREVTAANLTAVTLAAAFMLVFFVACIVQDAARAVAKWRAVAELQRARARGSRPRVEYMTHDRRQLARAAQARRAARDARKAARAAGVLV